MSIFGFGQGIARGHAHTAPKWDELTPGAHELLVYLLQEDVDTSRDGISNGARLELMHAGFITEENEHVSLTEGGRQMALNKKIG